MAPVTVTGRINWRDVQRLGQARRVAADKLAINGESGAPATITYTFVWTEATGAITADYAET